MLMDYEHPVARKRTARLAGLLYLVLAITGFFSLRYVPSKLVVWEDASKTFHNIMLSETLFRLDILAGIIGYTGFLILPLVLYKLLNHINKKFAIGMVALAVVSVPLSFIYLLYKFDVLTLIHHSGYLNTTSLSQLSTQVLLYLQFYDNGI